MSPPVATAAAVGGLSLLTRARIVVIVAAAGASCGRVAESILPGYEYPCGREKLVPPLFDVPAAWSIAAGWGSWSQETWFMARTAMLTQAWLALDS
ncbi:hypothetical protein AAGW05_16950 [Arthrobacter sp. LAPM80]|uniref:hypothetical protein n=1 Tax=Arthrobacter sp. LAPM80 TaxID=3141788 RepID=UPI00398B081C